MTTLKEISVTSIGEPYSVKIERGQKGGIGYEVGTKCEGPDEAVIEAIRMARKIEQEFGIGCQGGCKDAQQTA